MFGVSQLPSRSKPLRKSHWVASEAHGLLLPWVYGRSRSGLVVQLFPGVHSVWEWLSGCFQRNERLNRGAWQFSGWKRASIFTKLFSGRFLRPSSSARAACASLWWESMGGNSCLAHNLGQQSCWDNYSPPWLKSPWLCLCIHLCIFLSISLLDDDSLISWSRRDTWSGWGGRTQSKGGSEIRLPLAFPITKAIASSALKLQGELQLYDRINKESEWPKRRSAVTWSDQKGTWCPPIPMFGGSLVSDRSKGRGMSWRLEGGLGASLLSFWVLLCFFQILVEILTVSNWVPGCFLFPSLLLLFSFSLQHGWVPHNLSSR